MDLGTGFEKFWADPRNVKDCQTDPWQACHCNRNQQRELERSKRWWFLSHWSSLKTARILPSTTPGEICFLFFLHLYDQQLIDLTDFILLFSISSSLSN